MRAVLLDTAGGSAAAGGVALAGGVIYAVHGLYWLGPSIGLPVAIAVAFLAVRPWAAFQRRVDHEGTAEASIGGPPTEEPVPIPA